MAMDPIVHAGRDLVPGDPDVIRQRVAAVREGLERAAAVAGTPPATIIAVTKYLDAAGVRALYAAGLRNLAEARPERLAARVEEFADLDGVVWEMVGRLQSRQAPRVAGLAARIHSLSSQSAAARIARAGTLQSELLVQVNLDGDPAKGGVPATDVAAFLDELPEGLDVHGLMTMPARAVRPEDSRSTFAGLRELRDSLVADGSRHDLRELSMGTSQDYEVAAEEGATLVRVGASLYTLPSGSEPAQEAL